MKRNGLVAIAGQGSNKKLEGEDNNRPLTVDYSLLPISLCWVSSQFFFLIQVAFKKKANNWTQPCENVLWLFLSLLVEFFLATIKIIFILAADTGRILRPRGFTTKNSSARVNIPQHEKGAYVAISVTQKKSNVDKSDRVEMHKTFSQSKQGKGKTNIVSVYNQTPTPANYWIFFIFRYVSNDWVSSAE